jgi:hypothetical protein
MKTYKENPCTKTVRVHAHSKKLRTFRSICSDWWSIKPDTGKTQVLLPNGNSLIRDIVIMFGQMRTSGRKVEELLIESRDGHITLELSTVTEWPQCDQIPCDRDEIPTPKDSAYLPTLARYRYKGEELVSCTNWFLILLYIIYIVKYVQIKSKQILRTVYQPYIT